MKKLLVLIIFCFLFINGWNSQNHNMVVEKIYYSLSFQDQQKLDIGLMKEGSTDPDLKFHNTVLHHYPPTYELSLDWLKIMNESYENNWSEFSYAFGILSHYVSDSFSAPHNVGKEPSKIHSKFDSTKHISKIKCYNYGFNLNKSLYKASLQGKEDWTNYVLSYDKDIAKKEMDESIKLLYGIILSYNFTCNDFETKITNRGFYINDRVWIFLIILGFLIIIYLLYKIYKKKIL